MYPICQRLFRLVWEIDWTLIVAERVLEHRTKVLECLMRFQLGNQIVISNASNWSNGLEPSTRPNDATINKRFEYPKPV